MNIAAQKQQKMTGKIVGINGRFTHSCLALFYLRNEFNKRIPTLTTSLHQFTINDNYYDTLLSLTSGAPDYIFFSAAIWNSSLIEKLVLDLKQTLPDCHVIVGGPQAAVIRETLGNQCITVTGEIEAVGEQFYQDLRTGRLNSSYNANFFDMNRPEFSFPYLESDFDTHLQNKYIYYESSRGCPFSCSYCLSSVERRAFHKDIDTVQKELRLILAHNPQIVRFIDRTFNDIPSRALKIWRFLAQEGGETLFHFEIAPDRFTDEMFQFLKMLPPGKFQFEIGIQSTHQPTLDAVCRKIDVTRVRETITKLAEPGNIHLHVDLILGLPFETRESFARSFRDVFAMGAHYIQMGLLKILPDTPISRQVELHDYVFTREPPYSVLKNKWLEHHDITEMYWFCECVEKFINNRYFVSLWSYFRKSDENMYLLFDTILKKCLSLDFFRFAATHEFMCTILASVFETRADKNILLDLLRYDWLRCNNRCLPSVLVDEQRENNQEIRSNLYQHLPQQIDGVYDRKTRNQFLRKSYFLHLNRFSAAALGYFFEDKSRCFCFLAEKEGGIHNFNKVLLLQVNY